MKRSRFSEEQIAYALRQAEAGTPASDVCRQLGVSEATFYVWKKKFANLGVTELRKLRVLEEENARLKRVVADLTLDRHILQEVLRKNVWSAPLLQGSRPRTATVCTNVSGLSRASCGCSQAMMRSARIVPK
jgi:putative transposase